MLLLDYTVYILHYYIMLYIYSYIPGLLMSRGLEAC